MSREYSISSAGITLANQPVTLVFLNPGTTASIGITRLWVSQSGSTTSTQQRVQVETQVTAFPTLTTFTPAKLKRGDPVSVIVGGTAGAAGTCGINSSNEGAGAKTIIFEDVFNIVNGWQWVALPHEEIIMPASSASGIGLFLPVAPGSLANWAFGMNFREY